MSRLSKLALLAALLSMPVWPAAAQVGGGFAGGTVGLPAGGVPANPFASNYPSEPPAAMARRPREPRRVRRSRDGRAMPPPGRVGR